jgi:hypothetical protein
MSHRRSNFRFLAILVFVAILGVTAYGLWVAVGGKPSGSEGRRVAFYQDSMHPWVKSDQPGKCTICGMDLTPIYEGDQGFGVGDNTVVLSPNSISVLNVKIAEVKRQALCHTLRVAGTLEACETGKVILSAPGASRVDALAVAYTGVEVQKGQPLITLFSPELVQKGIVLRAAALNLGGMVRESPQAGSASDPFSVQLVSPVSGIVTERPVSLGQYVALGEKLLTVVDASVLWFRFDVYEQQLPWCTLGQTLDVEVPAVPGLVFPAVIEFIEPTINEATRTVKVRADVQNPLMMVHDRPQRLLRFGMYAEGRVAGEIPEVLAVPRTAVLMPGGSAYVYIDKGNGAYESRRVRLGRRCDDFWEVLQGLDEGDRVVTSGNVLIDAQAQFGRSLEPDAGMADESQAVAKAGAPIHAAMTMPDTPADAGGMAPMETTPASVAVAPPEPAPMAALPVGTMPMAVAPTPTAPTAALPAEPMPESTGGVPPGRLTGTRRQRVIDFMAERDLQLAMRQAAMAKAQGVTVPDATLLTPGAPAATPSAAPPAGAPTMAVPAMPMPMPTEAAMPVPAAAVSPTPGPPLTYREQDAARRAISEEMRQVRLAAMASAQKQALAEAVMASPVVPPAEPMATSSDAAMPSPGRPLTYREQDAARRALSEEMRLVRQAAMAKAQGLPAVEALTPTQQQAIKDFLAEAAGISQALASDDVGLFNQHWARLPVVLPSLKKELAALSRWDVLIQGIVAGGGDGKPAADLAAARQLFLPFSTATVEWVKPLRKEYPAFAGLKVYHCPMAPKPGLWMQAEGPLHNPFFGAQMPTCGDEVKP